MDVSWISRMKRRVKGPKGVGKSFLFLQGPHGPFFRQLARALKAEGASVLKVGVNRADDREWGGVGPYQPYTGGIDGWAEWLDQLMAERGVTDIVLYGDTRAYHANAVRVAEARGAQVHVFEEGYLRPYWVTYERGGSNGHSRLMDLSLDDMAEVAAMEDENHPEAPAIWGAAWRHALHGFRYHFDVLARNRAYPGFAPHRPTSVRRELSLYLKRMLVLPFLIPQGRARERQLLASGKTYHLVLLQMAVDASMRAHSDFDSVSSFIEHCLVAFRDGAAADQHIVFKTHPFEDGRERLERFTRRKAAELGLGGRVVFLHGGKLGALLDRARSAVTINSTAGQQALWRGLPISVNGRAVYGKAEFTTDQPLAEFFAAPAAPDAMAYRDYRQFLLSTSQVEGSFYTVAGRTSAVRLVVSKMLDVLDPYDRAFATVAAETANLTNDPKVALFTPQATAS
ncbi:MAG: capsule biosynthesis protein [Pikeienuella sp.]